MALASLDPDAFAGSPIAAGKAVIEEIRTALDLGKPIVLETTLSGRFALEVMRNARARGYEIELIFIGTSDVTINLARIEIRVANGGHNVPEADVRRRYQRSFNNLGTAISLADRVLIIDNSGDSPQLLIIMESGKRTIKTALPEWAKQYT